MARALDTKTALLHSGKREFLAHGFEGASLRRICANAKVTTGAFYTHFSKKEDLFDALIKDDLSEYTARFDGMMARLTAGNQGATDTEIAIMDFLVEHRELFQLLFNCAKGTRYEHFKDNLIVKFEESYQAFFDAQGAVPVEHEVTCTIVEMKFAQYCRMIFGNYAPEEVRLITQRLSVATQAGFEALLQTKF